MAKHEQQISAKTDEYKAAASLHLLFCPYCRAAGKRMFFATDVDLGAHVKTFHEPGRTPTA
jgi:hypothetical protein